MNVLDDFIKGRIGIDISNESLESILKLTPVFVDHGFLADEHEGELYVNMYLTSCHKEDWEIIFLRSKELDAYKLDGACQYKRTHPIVSVETFLASAATISIKESIFTELFE